MVRIPRSHRGGRGSIPRLGSYFCFSNIVCIYQKRKTYLNYLFLDLKKKSDPDETRTRNLLIRSQTRYPLRYEADILLESKYGYILQLYTQ